MENSVVILQKIKLEPYDLALLPVGVYVKVL